MEKALLIIEEMVRMGIIKAYAVGGGIGYNVIQQISASPTWNLTPLPDV